MIRIMEVCALLLLLLIPGTPAQQDLRNKLFVFPGGSGADYVILKANLTRPLENVTVCLNHFSDLRGRYAIFSLATPGVDNVFVISRDATASVYTIAINQQSVQFNTDAVWLDWLQPCVAWQSQTGVVRLWVNRKVYPRKVVARGSSISPNASIALGRQQLYFSQPFAGEMYGVNMWDHAFTWADINTMQWSSSYTGNVISWSALRYEMKGDVLLQTAD